MSAGLMRGFAFERRWLVGLVEVLIPAGADRRATLGAADVPMERFVDDLLDVAPMQFVLGLRGCIWALQLAPLVVLGRLATFLGLRESQQLVVLERLRQSDVYLIRELPLLLKTVGCLGFCGLPAVQAQLGIFPLDPQPPAWAALDGDDDEGDDQGDDDEGNDHDEDDADAERPVGRGGRP